jgi:hypothetical protein
MSSVHQESEVEISTIERSVWTRPEFARLETCEAEGVDGAGTEANGFLS